MKLDDGNFISVGGNATAPGEIRIYEDTDNGTNYSGFKVGNLTGSVAYQLPLADATASGQALTSNSSGILSWTTVASNTPSTADGQALGSAALEWSDLFLADASTIQFGADQDVILTHVADTGLLLSGTNVIQFNDASQNIGAPTNAILDINATDEIELNATLVDVNANLDVSGTFTLAGTALTATAAELNLLDDKDATHLAVPGKFAGTNFANSLLIGTTTTGTLNAAENNIGIGSDALRDITSGDANIALGVNAGRALTTNSYNTFIGRNSGISASGSSNVGIGPDSLEGSSFSGAGNMAIGMGSGANMSSGSFNTMIGNDSGDTITSGSGNIMLGNNVQPNSITGNRQLKIAGYDGSTTTTWISGDSSGNLTFAANTTIGGNLIIGSATVTEAQLEVLDGATITTTELNLIDGGATIGTTAVADGDGILHNDGGAMKVTSAATFKTYFQEGISTAYDDLTAGDAAVLITTSSGNITIDAAANDSDIIFKGTDGGADRVFMTIDGSAGGDLFLTGGLIDLKNDGSAVSNIKFYCESSNAHAQTLIGAPHSESADNVLTLPGTGGDARLVSTTSTATLTNKTLTSPVINTGTFGTSILPTSANGTTLGSASKEFADLFLSDGGQILFGADQDVTLTHAHNTGLTLKCTPTADDKPVSLTLQTGETDIAANDVIGKIDFQAPDENTGTDAVLVAAGIEAVSEGDFSSSANATSLVFKTGASEAAAGKIKVTSAGHLFPMADDSYDLGGSSNQWRNIYTGDLHLSNMSKAEGNVVDGTKGDWTIQEGSDELYLMNNNSGKKYKFNLTEV